jgi:hypothetical protein
VTVSTRAKSGAAFRFRLQVQVPDAPPFDEWTLDAACRGMIDKDRRGDDQWHPKLRTSGRTDNTAPGKRFCRNCPVKKVCLETALANDIRIGTWGGLSEWERLPLHDARNSHLI